MSAKETITFDPPITGGNVVGYDGSHASADALRWAVDEARAHSQPLHVVRAWVLSSVWRDTGVPFGTVPSFEECASAAAEGLRQALSEVGTDGVEVHQHVVHAPGAEALVAAGEHADLLVVGQRGRGGFAGLTLGSVADQVSRHAPTTVVIVR
jgi:nucleotide-binding universal stress UspA family protein